MGLRSRSQVNFIRKSFPYSYSETIRQRNMKPYKNVVHDPRRNHIVLGSHQSKVTCWGIEIAQLLHYSWVRHSSAPHCACLFAVGSNSCCLMTRFVWLNGFRIWPFDISVFAVATLALNWSKREVRKARPHQLAVHAELQVVPLVFLSLTS